jgi:hypothetical protein
MIRRWCRQSSPSLVSSGFLKAGTCPCAMAPPRNAALAEAQNPIRTSNYSSSEVRAPGHIRNKTVTAATQTPAIRNHAGAREVDTEIPLFPLSNIRAPCMSCTPIFRPFLSAASQTVGSVQPNPFTLQASATFATSGVREPGSPPSKAQSTATRGSGPAVYQLCGLPCILSSQPRRGRLLRRRPDIDCLESLLELNASPMRSAPLGVGLLAPQMLRLLT